MSDEDALAFEFVLGTLPVEERKAFLARLENDTSLQDKKAFWEAQLQCLNNPADSLAPRPDTWKNIQRSISPAVQSDVGRKSSPWFAWLPWVASAALSCLFVIALTLGQFRLMSSDEAPVDYVAVLTDAQGKARLTAVTEGDDQTMWLQWEDVALQPDQDLQIWALSKRDQQIRSIAVVDNQAIKSLSLSDAHWRLVTDAESLILTVEEAGGSPLDEPSEYVVAKGVCVRLESAEREG